MKTSWFNFLEYESSHVSWCEPKYAYSPWISEFFNAISSLFYIIFGAIQFVKFKKHLSLHDQKAIWVDILLILVGFGSVYFHATLSTAGELTDELGILWLNAFCVAWYFPIQIFPDNTNKVKITSYLTKTTVSVSAFSTLICRVYPQANSYTLLLMGQPFQLALIWTFIKLEHTPLRKALFTPAAVSGILSICCWLLDSLGCKFTVKIGFPYFHSVWHILSAYGCSHIIVLIIYYRLSRNSNQPIDRAVSRKFAPPQLGWLGVPYLEIDKSATLLQQ